MNDNAFAGIKAKKEIYLDETGDNGFKFSNGKTEPWFLIGAIIINSSDRAIMLEALELLAKKYVNGGQIKSKNWSDPQKRIGFINEIVKLPWHGVIFQVDKRNLPLEGFKFKQTFLKRVPRQLYNYLINAIDDVAIYPDPTGDIDFQNSLKKYLLSKVPNDLFGQDRFEFSRSIDCRLNQLADLCSGTRFRDIRDGTDYFDALKDKFNIVTWPISLQNYDFPEYVQDGQIERPIFAASVNFARAFLAKYEASDNQKRIEQYHVARILLDEVINGNPFRYLPTPTLRRQLGEILGRKFEDQYFKLNIIGVLRSSEVMIVSNRKGGYKLPVSTKEIEEYFINMIAKIEPMQYKAEILSKHYFTITGKQMLDDNRWKSLRKVTDDT